MATHLPFPIPTTATRAQLITDIGLYRSEALALATAEALEDAAEVVEDQQAAATLSARDASIVALQGQLTTTQAELVAANAAGVVGTDVIDAFQAFADKLVIAGVQFPLQEAPST